jgi:hypothetical protein
MKYLKWILKYGSRKPMAVWMISVVSGLVGMGYLIERWIHYLQIFVTSHQTTMATVDFYIISTVMLWVCVPAWIGYYFSDRRLFYDEYMKHSENW